MSCQAENNNIAVDRCAFDSGPPIILTGQENFTLGEENGYPEERIRQSSFDGFDIDRTEVTNADFANFVEATGYVTTAETPQPGFGKPGGAVFMSPTVTNPNWWQFVEGASWRHPDGPQSSIQSHPNDPVVQVSLKDALAYADWSGRHLPTEAQWEYAARGGTTTTYIWGDNLTVDGQEKANTWQGAFPIQNTVEDGFDRRAPVGCFDPNGYGLYDMVGNVWEWTRTEFPQSQSPQGFAIKGGSYLCAESFCARYRAPARQSQEADFSTNHIGFRTVSQTSGNAN